MSEPTLQERLSEPFPLASLGFKPQMVKNNRALAVVYIDARDVMDRLDAAVGPENWQDEFTPLPDGQVVCRLSLRVNGEWVAKSDVGGESEQPDNDDRKKAAFSDALKRAAVKWGVGRYLYSMPSQWCDYDPVNKAFTQQPQIPPQFLPRAAAKPAGKQPPAPKAEPEKPPAADPIDPVHSREALLSLLKLKGKDWPSCVVWLNAQVKPAESYGPKSKYLDMPEEHRRKLVAALRGMPDAPKKE